MPFRRRSREAVIAVFRERLKIYGGLLAAGVLAVLVTVLAVDAGMPRSAAVWMCATLFSLGFLVFIPQPIGLDGAAETVLFPSDRATVDERERRLRSALSDTGEAAGVLTAFFDAIGRFDASQWSALYHLTAASRPYFVRSFPRHLRRRALLRRLDAAEDHVAAARVERACVLAMYLWSEPRYGGEWVTAGETLAVLIAARALACRGRLRSSDFASCYEPFRTLIPLDTLVPA
jgi:hypothetical protein